jgi:DNA anti-recombination protein RmuC
MNQDYRGWIASDPNKAWALNYVGNDYNTQNYGINTDALDKAYAGYSASQMSAGPSDPVTSSIRNSLGGIGSRDTALSTLQDYARQYGSLQQGSQSPDSYAGASTTGTQSQQDSGMLGTIQNAFGNKINRYQSFLDMLPGRAQEDTNRLNDSFKTQYDLLKSSYQGGMNNMTQAAGENLQNKVRSFRDIASGIRNSVDAFRNKLGTMGAADSSAAYVTAPHAFATLQAQQRGDALNTYNQNQNNINLQTNAMETDYNNQIATLNSEKTARAGDIARQYQDMAMQIREQMANASDEQRMALAQMNQEAAARAIQSIAVIDQEMNNRIAQITQGATANLPGLQTDAFSQLALQQGYNPYGATTQANFGDISQAAQGVAMNPTALRRDDELNYSVSPFTRRRTA